MNNIKLILLAPLAFGRLLTAFLFTFLMYINVMIIDTVYPGQSEKRNRLLWKKMRLWAKSMLAIMGVKMNVTFEEKPEKPGLILSNHRSYIDIFINLAISPARIISKKEVSKWPMFGYGFKIYNVVIIDRENMQSRIQSMRKMERVLLDGHSLVIYPEGTTHKGPGIGSIIDSTFKIASKNNIVVYPIAIEYKNPEDAWVGDDLFVPHFIRRAGVWRRHVSVKIGQSIQTTDNDQLKNYVTGFMQRETLKMRAAYDDEHYN